MKNQTDDNQDPYQLISKLRKVIRSQQIKIEELQILCNSMDYQREIVRLQMMSPNKINKLSQIVFKKNASIFKSDLCSDQIKKNSKRTTNSNDSLLLLKMSPNNHLYKHDDLMNNKKSDLNLKSPQILMHHKSQDKSKRQFIPEDVKFHRRGNTMRGSNSTIVPGNSIEVHHFGDNFIEDFYVIGPNTGKFKKMKESRQNQKIIKVPPQLLFNINKTYKTQKQHFIQEIIKRAFPQGITAMKRIVESIEQIRNQLQYIPSNIMSSNYFIFTLKGDDSQILHPRNILTSTNPLLRLYAFCLSIPDFIYIRDEKHYQRQEHQIWIVQKIYIILSYYPIFNIHANILQHIESLLQKQKIYHIMVKNDDYLLWQLSRNIIDLQKNETIKQILHYFMHQKPNFHQVCYNNQQYYGTMPKYGFQSQYSVAIFTCPIFFSIFSYQQMLLLITCMFCGKTLIFISSESSVATLCALFLTNIIYPFLYRSLLLLNCDSSKIDTFVFENPFTVIASIKKTKDNFNQILQLFSLSINKKDKQIKNTSQYILIDIDTNTILYNNNLNTLFDQLIVSPNKELKQAYLQLNNCNSKSFSLPKQMPVQSISKYNPNKNEQIHKNFIKDCQQKLENNNVKLPCYKYSPQSEKVLKLLSEYINSFAIDKYVYEEFFSRKGQNRLQFVKTHLLQKHKDKSKLINTIIQSQIYTHYMNKLTQ